MGSLQQSILVVMSNSCNVNPSLQEEAVNYYTNLEGKLKEEYRKEREKVNSKPLGMAFVTFQNEAMTAL